MKKIVLALSLMSVALFANEDIGIKDLTIQNKATERVESIIKIKQCPEFTEQKLEDVTIFTGLKSFMTVENDNGITTTDLEYGKFKEGKEIIVKACEQNGLVKLKIESNFYSIPNKESLTK